MPSNSPVTSPHSQLLSNFHKFDNAPDAIPRLRRLILDLAVRGKLVEQDSNDEPATELLKRIAAEKERLVKEKKIKKPKVLPTITADEVPFQVPPGWELVRLGQALVLINGRAFKPSEWTQTGTPIIRIQNLNNPNAPFNLCDAELPHRFLIQQGDFLISWSGTPGTSFGAHIWNRADGFLNQHIFKAEFDRSSFVPVFLKLAINSRLIELISQAHGGVGLQHITKPKLEALALTLPPLAEQKRIVAKVTELMALCDRLEAAQAERNHQRNRLVAATHHQINLPACRQDRPDGKAGASDSSTRDIASFLFHNSNFNLHTSRPQDVSLLRQTILNLAVRGKLVPQDPNDEPAAELLQRIAAEKERLVAEKKIKKEKPLPEIKTADAPFNLPNQWSWARFPEVGVFGRGKSKHRPRNDKSLYDRGTYPLVQTGDVARSQGVITTYTNMYNDFGLAQSHMWPKGTLCITIAANIADSGLLTFDACFPDSVVGLLVSDEIPNARYFEYFVRTAKADLHAFAPSTAQKNINLGILNAVLIPLPPLAEQKRIVTRVDELMALCDALEAQLTTSQTESQQLLEACLNEAIA